MFIYHHRTNFLRAQRVLACALFLPLPGRVLDRREAVAPSLNGLGHLREMGGEVKDRVSEMV